MAVLVRSGRTSIPGLRRSLGAAGVPGRGRGRRRAARARPGRPAAARRAAGHPQPRQRRPDHVDFIDPARAEAHAARPARRPRRRRSCAGSAGCCGPGRRRAAKAEERAPRRSRELVREVLVDPGFLDGLDGPEVDRARAFVDPALAGAGRPGRRATPPRRCCGCSGPARSWPERLRRGVELGGAAARRAHRDLDAMVALFEAAARAEERKDHLGIANFLATLVAQQIPGDTLAERGVRGAVGAPAHRPPGQGPGVAAGGGRPRPAGRLARPAPAQHPAPGRPDPAPTAWCRRSSTRELLTEERRLFYVACTRARQRLVVTAVASADDEGEQPSRFLGELADRRRCTTAAARAGRCRWPGLVSDLRQHLADPDTPPGAARGRGAPPQGAGAGVGRRAGPLVPQADPATWWGTRAASLSAHPVRAGRPAGAALGQHADRADDLPDPALPVPRGRRRDRAPTSRPTSARSCTRSPSGSAPASSRPAPTTPTCSWSTSTRCGSASSSAPRGPRRASTPGSGRPWPASWPGTTPTPAPSSARRPAFTTVVELADGEQVRLGGYVDRLEVDHDGRVVVVDLKTGRTKPSGTAVQRDSQLALYQLAVDRGAVDEVVPDAAVAAVPSSSSSGPSTTARRPSSSARTRTPTTRPSARSCAPRWPSPPATCGARSSPPSPATTARTVPTSRCAPPRAPDRW